MVIDDVETRKDQFENLLLTRRILGLTLNQFSSLLKVTPTSLSHIERGTKSAGENLYLRLYVVIKEILFIAEEKGTIQLRPVQEQALRGVMNELEGTVVKALNTKIELTLHC